MQGLAKEDTRRIGLAADHAGYDLKEIIGKDLRAAGYAVVDVGTHEPGHPDDYPDFAALMGEAFLQGRVERAIVVCGSGVGVSVALNKFPGVLAAVCHDTYSARQGVEHDNMNALCLGSRIVGSELARDIVRAFLAASFSGEERHVRRWKKVLEIEGRFLKK